VVLAGDLDATGCFVTNRVVAAVVPERQLERLAAERATQQLMAEADAEDRNLSQQLADGLHGVPDHRRIPRAIAEKHAIGASIRQHRRCTGRGRDHFHRAQPAEMAQDGRLDPEVKGDDATRRRRINDIGRGGCHCGY